MRVLVNASSSLSRAAASRAFVSHSAPLPSYLGPSHVDSMHVWRHIYDQDAPDPNELPLGLVARRRSDWRHWDAPDTGIDERTARLCHTLAAAAGPPSPPMAAVSGEVKGNPTESEEDVAADRSDDDPLPPEKHNIIQMPAGEAAPKLTDAEESVAADRPEENPLSR
ncbi:hypothetical protein B0T26DRAFT_671367 [Lasiosphaeria miniovina]|uniref:Uncharacterized protein n=1 Tax=Lasiosphaeria miniovina TaxID=1954250 RepID=A0AA40BJ43_9PEZI|nr:uncharacterized protein B0T26DRAFT_671367 [Lasiosphaeria miniovina]KAK0735194.1 hypothetical protein B0T26DRAFT_671367 [Lasiosphaeria miniovina]